MKYIFNFQDKKVSRMYMIVGGVVVLGVVLYFIMASSTYSPSQPIGSEDTTEGTEAQEKQNTTTTTPVIPVLSYESALKMYANKRMQFDENCIVTPNFSVFKEGTKIMLDNRASKARTIYFDGVAYNLKVYGFKIITLQTILPLPHTIMIDCGNGKNNARILLQQ